MLRLVADPLRLCPRRRHPATVNLKIVGRLITTLKRLEKATLRENYRVIVKHFSNLDSGLRLFVCRHCLCDRKTPRVDSTVTRYQKDNKTMVKIMVES
jgi:hypothetical protein